MKTLILILFLFFSARLHADVPPGNNHIHGFNFLQCRQNTCVRVISPEASISIISGGFSTHGLTQLQLLDSKGNLKSAHFGSRAVYNPSLDMITLEDDTGGLLMYTPSKSQLTVYSPLAAQGVSK